MSTIEVLIVLMGIFTISNYLWLENIVSILKKRNIKSSVVFDYTLLYKIYKLSRTDYQYRRYFIISLVLFFLPLFLFLLLILSLQYG